MIRLLIAAGIGYVLGTRAGRERYEQLLNFSKNLQGNPAIAEAVAAARKQASEIIGGEAKPAGFGDAPPRGEAPPRR